MTQNSVQNYYCYTFNMEVHIDMSPSIKHLRQRKIWYMCNTFKSKKFISQQLTIQELTIRRFRKRTITYFNVTLSIVTIKSRLAIKLRNGQLLRERERERERKKEQTIKTYSLPARAIPFIIFFFFLDPSH